MAHAWRLPSKRTPTRPCPRRKVRGKKKRSSHGPKKKHFRALDVLFRKPWQSPSDTDWSLAWYVFPLHWKDRASAFMWSETMVLLCVLATLEISIAHRKFAWTSLGSKMFVWNSAVPIPLARRPFTRAYHMKKRVDTKVGGHGWRTRNSTIIGLHFLKFLQVLPDVRKMCRKIAGIHLLFFSPPVPKMDWPYGVQALNIDLATIGHCPRDTTHIESTSYLCKAKTWHWWSSISHVNAAVSNFGPPDCTDENWKNEGFIFEAELSSLAGRTPVVANQRSPQCIPIQSTWRNVVKKSVMIKKNGCYLPIFGSITTFDLHSVNVPQSVLHLWNHVSAVILVFFPRFLHHSFWDQRPRDQLCWLDFVPCIWFAVKVFRGVASLVLDFPPLSWSPEYFSNNPCRNQWIPLHKICVFGNGIPVNFHPRHLLVNDQSFQPLYFRIF